MNPWLERRVLNIAHQGGDHEAPSNTLHAFAHAAASGAHMLEIDVHATADGHVVVCHDETVDRTTNGSGPIESLTLQEIRALDAAHWFVPGRGPMRDAADYPMRATGVAIPTLDETLAHTDLLVSIDIKRGAPDTTSYAEQVADLLHRHGATERAVVASFSDAVIQRFRAIAPGVPTSAATQEAYAFFEGGAAAEYKVLALPFEFGGVRVVTAELVARAHDQGVAVHVWTINDPELVAHLIEIGADGVVTDRPAELAPLFA